MDAAQHPSARSARRAAGVRDVAARAGVSTQTVSRVINDSPSVRAETRSRVLSAMEELGFRANNAARALGTRSTRTLGVIASDAEHFGPSAGIAVLEDAARQAGRWIATAYADAASEASVQDAAERLLAQGVDGIVVLAPHAGSLAALQARVLEVPLGVLHGDPEPQEAGIALAVSHLADHGHRRLALLSGPADWLEARARERGFDGTCARLGLTAAGRWEGDWTARTAAALAPALAAAIRTPDGPSAIVVANDQMALGLMAGLRAEGVEVPHDVSVVGFDDNPDAAYYRPALTTVRLDLAGEARRCVAEVLGLPAPPAPAAPELVVRSSTARSSLEGSDRWD
ncbi:LacI family DNA-binding transcriptional regulator [Microbacterium aureliae]